VFLLVAGDKKEVKDGLTVRELIESENIENPDYVTVAVNDDFVESETYGTRALNENDNVEFLYFMGGGSR